MITDTQIAKGCALVPVVAVISIIAALVIANNTGLLRYAVGLLAD
ncbi:hypothetical protein [Bradyrhizobium sp. SZCCHNR2009]|nr:hypothetical protein [Bradyrhizobium sp. SZCCHNR2009]